MLDLGLLSPDDWRACNRAVGSFSGALDPDELFARVTEAARGLLAAHSATLQLFDIDRLYLPVRAASGVPLDRVAGLATRIGENLAGAVAARGTSLSTSDILTDSRSTLGDVCRNVIKSSLLVPLVAMDATLGVLAVQTRDERRFSRREEVLLQVLADRAAMDISMARMQRSRHVYSALLQAVGRSSDAHHDALLEILQAQFPSPLILADRAGRRLSPSGRPGAREEGVWNVDERDILDALERGLGAPIDLGVVDLSREISRFVAPIVVEGELIGALVALDRAKLDEWHFNTLEESTSIFAVELLKQVHPRVTATPGSLIVETIFSFTGSTDDLYRQVRDLGYNLLTDGCVGIVRCIHAGRPMEPNSCLAIAEQAARSAGLRAAAGVFEDEVTAIITGGSLPLTRSSVDSWAGSFLDALKRSAGTPALQIGLSENFLESDDIRRGLLQARQAISYGGSADSNMELIRFDDLSLVPLIDFRDPDAVEEFLARQIGKLVAYDERKNGALLRTLETYLDYSCVTLRAARALFIHPHSLRYRIRRIQEIQEVNLEEAEARLAIHLAIKLNGQFKR